MVVASGFEWVPWGIDRHGEVFFGEMSVDTELDSQV